ncbi:cysteine desulfurase [Reichenbachiella carrageenanivorans]|uniref:cysteine desulfurase n=1 Tax=Reichenbachiella carrageenanivorans TaxID=2979869 RepID=A0ABY6D2H3_9BACT|nr:cysteine desulfurase family protein [Reichenbachiella carrageenanivorans]UXX80318.1 cysteine desulfurase [Reichenbachiella carrageenanivorans]
MKVYLDNSATTPMDPEVFEAMTPYFMENYGNPSSIHSHGRQARSTIEKSRKKIADLLNTSPAEIFFTSGGTEADNTAILSTIESLGVKRAITSKLEHHAVLHTLEYVAKTKGVDLQYVDLDADGRIDLEHLVSLVQNTSAFVSLMHANNEIGNLNNIPKIGELVKEHGGYFHSDTVQAMGKYVHDLSALKVDFVVGAAHKIYGPKGSGFLYINHETKIAPFIHGGAQERNMRGGTENVAGIVGLAKALEIAYRDMEHNRAYISSLKERMLVGLKDKIIGATFNGLSGNMNESLYSVINVGLPATDENDMLLFSLDIKGVSASGGSACASGSNIGSHVLTALNVDPDRGAIRFSFSKYTKPEEVDYAVAALAELMH